MLTDARFRNIAFQAVVLIGFCALLIGAALTAWGRIQEQGMTYGLGVLMRSTGWDVSSVLADQTISDPYWWTLTVAVLNTVLVSIIGILLATILGFVIGVLRHAGNPLLSKVLGVYVELFRNIPLLLQLLFWYATFTQLPPSREPIVLAPGILLSNAGLFMPSVTFQDSGVLALLLIVLGLVGAGIGIWRGLKLDNVRSLSLLLRVPLIVICLGAIFLLAMSVLLNATAPEVGRFNITGGFAMPIELFTLIFAIMIFSSSYIAEIVRGGLQSVPKGIWEAADAMSLSKAQTYIYVTLPVAVRAILPSLSNQYVFIVKSTALGIAIGFSDIFAVSVRAITQTGQTIEFLGIMMAIYLVLNYSLTSVLNFANHRLSLARR